jgi:prepilin-type processing-associated H-X9-DG protein
VLSNNTQSGALSPRGVDYGSGNPIAAITDGLSNTLLMAEFSGRGLGIYMRGRMVAPVPSTNAQLAAINPAPLNPVVSADMYVRGSWQDHNGTPTLTSYAINAAGNQVTPNSGCNSINVTNHMGPYSMHSGGVNSLRCDGSVVFVRESTTAAILMAYISRAGGETLQLN